MSIPVPFEAAQLFSSEESQAFFESNTYTPGQVIFVAKALAKTYPSLGEYSWWLSTCRITSASSVNLEALYSRFGAVFSYSPGLKAIRSIYGLKPRASLKEMCAELFGPPSTPPSTSTSDLALPADEASFDAGYYLSILNHSGPPSSRVTLDNSDSDNSLLSNLLFLALFSLLFMNTRNEDLFSISDTVFNRSYCMVDQCTASEQVTASLVQKFVTPILADFKASIKQEFSSELRSILSEFLGKTSSSEIPSTIPPKDKDTFTSSKSDPPLKPSKRFAKSGNKFSFSNAPGVPNTNSSDSELSDSDCDSIEDISQFEERSHSDISLRSKANTLTSNLTSTWLSLVSDAWGGLGRDPDNWPSISDLYLHLYDKKIGLGRGLPTLQFLCLTVPKHSEKSAFRVKVEYRGSSMIAGLSNKVPMPTCPAEMLDTLKNDQMIINKMCDPAYKDRFKYSYLEAIGPAFLDFQSALKDKMANECNPKFQITHFAIILQLYLWFMNKLVLTQDPSILRMFRTLWDSRFKHLFTREPTKSDLLDALFLLLYNCGNCNSPGAHAHCCEKESCLKLITTHSKSNGAKLNTEFNKWKESAAGKSKASEFGNNSGRLYNHFKNNVADKALVKEAEQPSRKYATFNDLLTDIYRNQDRIPFRYPTPSFYVE